jgi:hypothetical protein
MIIKTCNICECVLTANTEYKNGIELASNLIKDKAIFPFTAIIKVDHFQFDCTDFHVCESFILKDLDVKK